jgi:hypothetical protein
MWTDGAFGALHRKTSVRKMPLDPEELVTLTNLAR